jgi:hypothetical protein
VNGKWVREGLYNFQFQLRPYVLVFARCLRSVLICFQRREDFCLQLQRFAIPYALGLV